MLHKHMRIKDFAQIVHRNAVDKGFYTYQEDPYVVGGQKLAVNIDQKLVLVIGELIEGHEELRSARKVDEIYYREKDSKPEGFGMELADAVIRIFDLAEALDLDIEALMLEKHAFNTGRPFKHGREF